MLLKNTIPKRDVKQNYNSTFIAFLDILGFKDIVDNNSHEDLIKIFEDIIEKNYEFTISLLAKATVKEKDKVEESYQINSMLVSDSLIFWTDNNSPMSLTYLILTVQQLLHYGIGKGIPLRGTITMGPLFFKKNTYNTNKENFSTILIGKGFTDAYTNESKQNWSGCIITKECVERFEKISSQKSGVMQFDFFLKKKILIKYNVPYKDGLFKNEYAIDWVNFHKKDCFTEDKIRNSFSKHKKPVDKPEVESKILNTIKFFAETYSWT